jgi:hypothetical protein
MRLVTNKTGGEVVLHFTSTETVTVAGNNSVSNVATSTETVNSATITQLFWGTDDVAGAHWQISRGANVVAILSQSGSKDFAGTGMSLRLDPTADLSATLVGSANGYVMIEMQKASDIVNNPYLVG